MKKITIILLIVCVFCNSQSMLIGFVQKINHYQKRFDRSNHYTTLLIPFSAVSNQEITFLHHDEIEWKGNRFDIKNIILTKKGYQVLAIWDKKETVLHTDIESKQKNKTDSNIQNYQLLFYQSTPNFCFWKSMPLNKSKYTQFTEKIYNTFILPPTPPPLC